MGRPSAGPPARRWFDALLRGLPATVRYRLFGPSYEDLRHDHLLRLARARWPGERQLLSAVTAFRVLALVAACYRDSPEFVLVHPLRAIGAGTRGVIASSRTMLIHDIRQAFRSLRRQPVFSATAIAILALGIGSSTAIFSVVSAVLLEPLPFPDAGRLVNIEEVVDGRRSAVSPVNANDWREQAKSFQGMALYAEGSMTLTWRDRAEAVNGYGVSSSFFPVLGISPVVGRWFDPEDDRSPGPSSVVLSHGLWQRVFGGSRDVVNQQVMFDGKPVTVIGVAPAGAEFPEKAEAWFSLALPARNLAPEARGAHYVSAIARLRAGATIERANAEMHTIAAGLAAAYPRTNRGSDVQVQDLVQATVGSARQSLWFVLGAVGVLLLIACVNVSGLLIARAATRGVEMTVRSALGAGRIALVRQAMVESLVLAGLAAGIGTLIAAWSTRAILAVAPADIPRASQAGLDLRVLAFTALVSAVAALLCGSLPAVQSMTGNMAWSLKASQRDGGISGSRRLRGALVAAEVALALMLLVGGSLAVQSFERLSRVSPGFDPRGVLTFTLSLPDGVYKEDAQVAAFFRDLIGRLNQVRGVRSSAGIMIPPVSSSGFSGTFSIDGRPEVSGPDEPHAQMRPITPSYFRTLGIPIVQGRTFDDRDGAAAPPVAIISEMAAKRFWPGESPIGRRLRMHVSATGSRQPFREIVGIARDVKNSRLDLPSAPMVYIPHAQHATSTMAMMVRTDVDPASAEGAVADAVRQADKTLVPLEMRTLEAHVALSRADQRFRALLLGLFAGSAFVLAIVGLYAVVAYTTSRRRHELGIRIVVGATAGQVVGLVVRDGMRPVIAGIALGCAGAVGVSRLMRSMLFGAQAFDPALVAGVAAAFALAAAVACYLPARRATTFAPTDALRAE